MKDEIIVKIQRMFPNCVNIKNVVNGHYLYFQKHAHKKAHH